MLHRALVEGFRRPTSRYDSPRTTLGVLKEDPKSNPQDPLKLESCPKWGDLRKGSTPRRSIQAPWMASVGQGVPNQATTPDHEPTARSVNGLTVHESRSRGGHLCAVK
uniref:Uncharacterized protein n=1 Tax=Solanum tuberosum TaxID=4113 RepID=M1DL73_SOLTU